MLGAGIELKKKAIDFDSSPSTEEMGRLLRSLEEVDELVSSLGAEGRPVPGYIVRRDGKEESPYDDFAPVPSTARTFSKLLMRSRRNWCIRDMPPSPDLV